jgi:hypothetical protein
MEVPENEVPGDSRQYASVETLQLSPSLAGSVLPKDAWRALALNLIYEIEEEAALRMSRTGRQPLGAAAIRGRHPHDRPRNSKRAPAPLFHAVSARVRRELWEAYRLFVAPSERRQKSSEWETATPSFRSAASLQPCRLSEDDPKRAFTTYRCCRVLDDWGTCCQRSPKIPPPRSPKIPPPRLILFP